MDTDQKAYNLKNLKKIMFFRKIKSQMYSLINSRSVQQGRCFTDVIYRTEAYIIMVSEGGANSYRLFIQ